MGRSSVLEPVGLEKMMRASQLVEDHELAKEARTEATQSTPKPNAANPKSFDLPSKPTQLVANPNTQDTLTITLAGQTSATQKNNSFKRLPDAQYQARKEKGFCFGCDKRYTAGHQCKNKELRVIMVHDDATKTEMEFDNEEPMDEETITMQVTEVGEAV